LKSKAKFLFRLLLSLSIFAFATNQVIYGVENQDLIILVMAAIIGLIFAQYSILNLTYLFAKHELEHINGKLLIKVGNLEASVEPSKIAIYKIKNIGFLLLKDADVKLSKYPFLANFIVKSPFLFHFSLFGCHSYPMFFRDNKALEKFREINRNIFGEEIVISAELLSLKEISVFLQDHTL
jgi:hypothetical protein